MIFKIILTSSLFLSISGCSLPPSTGDSMLQSKNISYPQRDKVMKIKSGDLVYVITNYESKFIYKINQPLNINWMLGKVVVAKDDEFFESTINEKKYYCSSRKIIKDGLGIPQSEGCFLINTDGKSTSLRAKPGMIPLTKEIGSSIDFAKIELPIFVDKKVLKRELIYDGAENSTLAFTLKLYEKSLNDSSRSRPVLIRAGVTPFVIKIEDVNISIISYEKNILTYEILQK